MNKNSLKNLIPASIWRYARRRRILKNHAATARICENLIEDYFSNPMNLLPKAKKDPGTKKIIWQYWAQGYSELPEVVQRCLSSIEKYAEDYQVIRLDDNNLSEYLELPEYVTEKRDKFSIAHFSDLLRVLLLSTYGGVWMDATVMLSAPLPKKYEAYDFFMFQRDKDERNTQYWEDTYAYYFGWHKGFRVNVLNSILFAKQGSLVISTLSGLLLKWWQENDTVPDYFFFQILFDVLINGRLKDHNCPIVSDCIPHHLQQLINDMNYTLMAEDDILSLTPVHKLTYK